MREAIITLVALTLLAPLAAANEAKADCEADQQWIGYRTTDGLRRTYEALGSPGGAAACEGEHWDGQDGVDPARACPAGDPMCHGSDPNPGPAEGPWTGATARASPRVEEGSSEAYASANVLLVGRFAVYAGACEAGARGLEGASSCQSARQHRVALYARDNTPGNMLCILVGSIGITGPYCVEGDVTHAEYVCMMNGGCGRGVPRDNTAVTIEQVLP